MHEPVRFIYSPDGRCRVTIFRRHNGTFGFESASWAADVAAWVPSGRYSESFVGSADEAASEATGRVQWLASAGAAAQHAPVPDADHPSGARSVPAFLVDQQAAPIYHGFPVVPETWTDGWAAGVMVEEAGDQSGVRGRLYIVSPDGLLAGLSWEVGPPELLLVSALEPAGGLWGLFDARFSAPARTPEELATRFREVLPSLRDHYRRRLNPRDA